MLKLRRCEELVTGNGKQYLFAGTFGNIEALSFLSGDPADLFTRLAAGKTPPTDIRNLILCTLEQIDGEPVDEAIRDTAVTEFVEDFGLQDCSLLARHLISHAVIGTVKKKQLDRQEIARGMVQKLRLSTLIPFGRRGWQWAAVSAVLVVPACMIFKSL